MLLCFNTTILAVLVDFSPRCCGLKYNEGFWESEIGVTSYFGPATKKAVMKFQNQYKTQILKPLGLSSPTGFFGPYTRKYLNENIFIGVKNK
ncbi:hypothetical protein KKH16_00190 [Patescibacteria group bacterium]|nr:hypothetical protein [Patescibacteria group bacterium]